MEFVRRKMTWSEAALASIGSLISLQAVMLRAYLNRRHYKKQVELVRSEMFGDEITRAASDNALAGVRAGIKSQINRSMASKNGVYIHHQVDHATQISNALKIGKQLKFQRSEASKYVVREDPYTFDRLYSHAWKSKEGLLFSLFASLVFQGNPLVGLIVIFVYFLYVKFLGCPAPVHVPKETTFDQTLAA